MTTQAATAGTGEALSAVLEEKDKLIPCEIVETAKEPNCQKVYTLKVASAEFVKHVEDVLKDYQKDVNIPGFRKGKAPMNLVRNQFAKHANNQAAQQLAGKLAQQLVKTENLSIVGQPGFVDWKLDDDKNAIIKVVHEVEPVIELSADHFKGLSVEVLKQEVTDQAVADELENIRNQSAVFDETDVEYAYAAKDAATISISATDLQGNDLPALTVAFEYSENLEKELPAPLLAAMVGKTAGDIVEVTNVEIGEGNQKSQANFKLTIHAIRKRVVPALDDEFAKDVDAKHESLESLKAALRADLVKRFETNEKNQALNAAYAKLQEKLEFEAPLTMLRDATNRSLYRTDQHLRQNFGVALKKLNRALIDNFITRSQADAEIEVKNILLGRAIVKHFNVEVTEDVLNAEIAKIAEVQGRKPLAVRANLEAQKKLEEFQNDLKLRLTHDQLLSHVEVKRVDKLTEKPAENAAAESTAPAES
ncbi:MAG: trigger factor [Candidatus Sumerlaeia bacterium]|nr:trigger factor [Candidatus Sumerlaeia bacterium]